MQTKDISAPLQADAIPPDANDKCQLTNHFFLCIIEHHYICEMIL